MPKTIIRMAAAVAVAGAVALAVTFAPAANGNTLKGDAGERALPLAFAKADRLRVPVTARTCMQHNWPNFEVRCLFDAREPAGEARTVRVIALR